MTDSQNYTGTYVIMDCLQALVNNLLVWQAALKASYFLYTANLFVQLLSTFNRGYALP